MGAGGFKFGGLGLQGQPNAFSVRNIFEVSCNEYGTGISKGYLWIRVQVFSLCVRE